jgi:hypothetical protein
MFDLTDLVSFAHDLESAFVIVRDQNLTINQRIIDLTLAATDHLSALVEGRPIEPEEHEEASRIVRALEEVVGSQGGHGRSADDSPEPAEPKPTEPEEEAEHEGLQKLQLFRIEYRPSHHTFIHGTNPLALIQELRETGDVLILGYVSQIPTLDAYDPEGCYLAWDFLVTTTQPRQAIEDIFMFIDEGSDLDIAVVEPGEYRRIGEILVDRGDLTERELEALLADRPPLGEVLVQEGVVSQESVRSALEEQKWASQFSGRRKDRSVYRRRVGIEHQSTNRSSRSLGQLGGGTGLFASTDLIAGTASRPIGRCLPRRNNWNGWCGSHGNSRWSFTWCRWRRSFRRFDGWYEIWQKNSVARFAWNSSVPKRNSIRTSSNRSGIRSFTSYETRSITGSSRRRCGKNAENHGRVGSSCGPGIPVRSYRSAWKTTEPVSTKRKCCNALGSAVS